MKEGQSLWTREELILTLNLYSKITFGQMNNSNKQVHELAKLIGRTSGAVVRRLANFASMDPVQIKRGIKGLPNAGGLAEKIWNEFYNNWDKMFEESDELLAKYKQTKVEDLYPLNFDNSEIGLTKERLVRTRLNQYRFRQLVLSNFNNTCCITGIKEPEVLIASHITSWSVYSENRLNPANGLCLNALHDKAFDKGLITIMADDYTIKISPKFKKKKTLETEQYFLIFEGKQINLPKKFMPDPEFLKVHNNAFFENK